MPMWPSSLPQEPLVDGYKRTLPNNLIRSSMDTGSDKVRLRGRSKPVGVTATYVLTNAQRDTLETFIHDGIAEGAVCFDWPWTEKDTFVRARIKAGSDGLFDIQRYKDTMRWQVTLNLEIWPDAPLT